MLEDYEPFENVEEVWFWFCGCIIARGDGLRCAKDYVGKVRNCEVGDIYRIIKRMKIGHQISNRHLRIMAKWGGLSCPPYYDKRAKRSEIVLWDEGLSILEKYLRDKRII